MSTMPMTIWTNRRFDDALDAALARAIAPHALRFADESHASNRPAAVADATLREECEIAFGQPLVGDVLAARKLKLVCLSTAGYTAYDRDDVRAQCAAKGVAICNASSVYADPCAQHVLAMILAGARRMPYAFQAQVDVRNNTMSHSFRRTQRDVATRAELPAKGWNTQPMRAASVLLQAWTTVAIAGYGSIARRLVELLAPFGCRIVAFRRSPRGDENCETLPIDAIDEHLPMADHVVNVLPASASTKHFFDAARFKRFKRGAHFYNVGRGDTADQPALVRSLVDGRIGFAFLDVTTPEPLPADDPLWMAPNCYITPHTAGGSRDESERQIAHVAANVRRLARGEPLVDQVI